MTEPESKNLNYIFLISLSLLTTERTPKGTEYNLDPSISLPL